MPRSVSSRNPMATISRRPERHPERVERLVDPESQKKGRSTLTHVIIIQSGVVRTTMGRHHGYQSHQVRLYHLRAQTQVHPPLPPWARTTLLQMTSKLEALEALEDVADSDYRIIVSKA